MSTKLNYEELIITPEMAKEILSKSANENNRSINRANVLTYAKMMKEGKWTLDGEPIVFDWNNTLSEGHHRMHAVVEAGVPVEFSVIRNVNPETFKVTGVGRARSTGDIFKMRCIENYTNVASIVRKFDMLNKNWTVTTKNMIHDTVKLTNEEALDLYDQHPEEFQEFCNYAGALRNHRHYYNISELGGIIAYLNITLGYNKELIYNFFNCIFQYKTLEEHPLCMEVREAITKAALEGYKLPGVYKQAILATAWNVYSSGNKKRKKLRVPLKTAPIPFE